MKKSSAPARAYYGKYRGKVLDNFDLLGLGRILADVPAISAGGILNWALPCVPYAGPGVGFFAIPPVGANVWIEFEGGDLRQPIWTGCFWSEGQAPKLPGGEPTPKVKLFKTEFCTLALSDIPKTGGVTLNCQLPAAKPPKS